MCCPSRNDEALAGYELWKSKADGNSACDYAFHMAVTKFEPRTAPELEQIVRDGIFFVQNLSLVQEFLRRR